MQVSYVDFISRSIIYLPTYLVKSEFPFIRIFVGRSKILFSPIGPHMVWNGPLCGMQISFGLILLIELLYLQVLSISREFLELNLFFS